MELRDLNLSFFMKSFIFSDVSTLLYLLRKRLILTYLLLFYDQLPDFRFSIYMEEKGRQKGLGYAEKNLNFLSGCVHSSTE